MEVVVTVELGVGDESTGVDDLVTFDSDGFAVAALEVTNGPVFPL